MWITVPWRGKMARFITVGVASNAIVYLGYVALTSFGLEPKAAMSLMYAVGMAQGFLLNRVWTFAHKGTISPSLGRYVVVYLAGYVVNWIALFVFIDYLRFPHLVVQGIAVLVLAVALFTAQRYWVFRNAEA